MYGCIYEFWGNIYALYSLLLILHKMEHVRHQGVFYLTVQGTSTGTGFHGTIHDGVKSSVIKI
jgi:hypothetical protein